MGVILTLHSALFTRHYLPVELRLLIEKYMIEKLDNDSIEDTLLQYQYGDDIDREFVTMLYGNIEWWDTSAVTDMSSLFMLRNHFNTDITNWDVSNVKNMDYMFYQSYEFNQPIGKWNVSNVVSMNYMFCFSREFNQPLNAWNTSKVESMHGMFMKAGSFNQPLDAWDVTNVEDMKDMFTECNSFKHRLPPFVNQRCIHQPFF